jgi:Leucine-rich repeat (LRR) protein
LESLFLDGTLLGDRSVNQLVSSIASSPTGNDTLQQLSLWENQLTRIPDHISSFRKLSYVNLFGNSIVSVPSGSFVFRPEIQVSFLILSKNALNTIEPGAFKGKCISYRSCARRESSAE